jgi:hypothetical protein
MNSTDIIDPVSQFIVNIQQHNEKHPIESFFGSDNLTEQDLRLFYSRQTSSVPTDVRIASTPLQIASIAGVKIAYLQSPRYIFGSSLTQFLINNPEIKYFMYLFVPKTKDKLANYPDGVEIFKRDIFIQLMTTIGDNKQQNAARALAKFKVTTNRDSGDYYNNKYTQSKFRLRFVLNNLSRFILV